MNNKKIVSIDADILIYAFNQKSIYRKSALQFLSDILKNKKLVIVDIVLIEFFQVITDSSKVEKALESSKASKIIDSFLHNKDIDILETNFEILSNSFSTISDYNIRKYSIYEYIVYNTLKYYNIHYFYTTNNEKFDKYTDLKLMNPFEKKNIDKNKVIPYGKQDIDKKDIQMVVNTLKSDYLTQGPAVQKFEEKLCEYTGAKYAVAVANGTAALHLAVKALNLENDFEGVTTPNTFVASANSIVYNNGTPVFSDIESDTHNIDVQKIQISDKTKVLIPVDFAGHPCDMEEIYKIARENKLFIVRDSCHSIGSLYKNEKTGNGKYSDMTIFSFHPVKHITTGEGGAILTNDETFYQELLLLRSHGITKLEKLMTKNEGPWYYEMIDLGYNYRITDIQCALGISQLEKLDRFVERRREIVAQYNEAFKKLEYIKLPVEREYVKSSYHLYVVEIDFDKIGMTRQEFMMQLKEKKILTQVHYIPVHLQPYYQKQFNYKTGDYIIAETYYKKALSLPLYPKMTDKEVQTVIEAIKVFL